MYVFGIDLPIMELLFVFGIFLFAALVIIWLEIRRLRDLLTAEKANLSRFGKDLSKEETQQKSSLDESVRSALKKGYTKQAIKTALVNRGWHEDVVNKALEKN